MFSFLNFHKDPNDKNRYVFYFKDTNTAADFKQLCEEYSIPFKKLTDPQKPDIFYFSFHKSDFEDAQRLNADAMGKNPKSFLPDKTLRIFTLSIFFIMLALAIVGYLVSKFG